MHLLLALCFLNPVAAQQPTAALDNVAPLLTPFQQRVLLAFSPTGLPFKGMTLTGTIDRKAGSTRETGTIKLQVSADGSSGEEWTSAGDNRIIRITPLTADRTCKVTSKSSTTAKDLSGNACQRVIPWFAPWLAGPLLSATLATATEKQDQSGRTVLSIAPAYGAISGMSDKTQQSVRRSSDAAFVDVSFDTATALPSGLHFTEQLSTEATNAIDVSVVYSDYRLELGFMVPHHIQRYLQHTLEADIHITNVVLN